MSAGERPKATRHATHTFVTVYATSVEAGGSPGLGVLASRLHFTRVSAFILPGGTIQHMDDAIESSRTACSTTGR